MNTLCQITPQQEYDQFLEWINTASEEAVDHRMRELFRTNPVAREKILEAKSAKSASGHSRPSFWTMDPGFPIESSGGGNCQDFSGLYIEPDAPKRSEVRMIERKREHQY